MIDTLSERSEGEFEKLDTKLIKRYTKFERLDTKSQKSDTLLLKMDTIFAFFRMQFLFLHEISAILPKIGMKIHRV